MILPNDDRLAQLKLFDETKAGVKGLVDAGISTIPSIFLNPDGPLPSQTRLANVTIPTIDLSGIEHDPKRRGEVVKMVQDALEKWGFFQVVNHGIPEAMLGEMLKSTKCFFELDYEVKKGYYSRDFTSRKFLHNSNFDLYKGEFTNWRDSFSFFVVPSAAKVEEVPPCLREILVQYSEEMMKLGKTLFELISEALGLKSSYLDEIIGSSEGLLILGHYYPICPQPELTMGQPAHADNDFLTLLLQDQIGGLQVLHDDQWFDVPPTPGALVINAGDYLQLVSNDRFKSVKHRVPANTRGPRMSVGSFFKILGGPSTRLYGPIKEILSESNPPVYREATSQEIFLAHAKTGQTSTSILEYFRL